MVTVYNLATGETREYSCDSLTAVISAYAQSKGDYNTWDYTKNYLDKVVIANRFYNIEDWSTAIQDGACASLIDSEFHAKAQEQASKGLQGNLDLKEVLDNTETREAGLNYLRKQALTPVLLSGTGSIVRLSYPADESGSMTSGAQPNPKFEKLIEGLIIINTDESDAMNKMDDFLNGE